MSKRQSDKIFNKKAQSILELAIFGSIVLFVFSILLTYGMNLNYRQHLNLQSFREALRQSKSSVDSPSKSLTVIKDKPVPNPTNPFGVGETMPIISQANAVWSRYLMYELDITKAELPTVQFRINGITRSYTTAAFREHNCNGMRVRKKKTIYTNLPEQWYIAVGPCWEWEYVEDRKLENGDAIDIDNDNKIEQIVKVKGDPDDLDKFWYLDYQLGDMDLTIEPEEGYVQGLQDETIKDVTTSGTIRKTESPSGISSSRSATATERIQRFIRTRSGVQTVNTTVIQQQSSDW